MRRITQALPTIENPNELIVGSPDGEPTILSGGSIGDALTIDGDGEIAWAVGGGGGSSYTFTDTDSIDFVVTGPVVEANAIFGDIAGTVAEGDHTHAQLHDPVVANDTDSINFTQVGQTLEAAAIFGTGAGTVAEGDHDHDSVYAAIVHNHDASYSLLGHNHDASYSPLGHNHTGVYQPLNASLTTLSGVTLGAIGLSLLDDVAASDARTTLGLSTLATMLANSVAFTGGSITGITDLAVADGGTGASSASSARTNLGLVIGTDVAAQSHVAATGTSVHGLGTMSTQAASSVAITGGTITGITDLTVADGGTGASNAASARTNLGLVIGTDVAAYSHAHGSDVTVFNSVEDFEKTGVNALVYTYSGDGSLTKANDTENHPGAFTMTSGNSNNNVGRLFLGAGAAQTMFNFSDNFDTTFVLFTDGVATREIFVGLTADASLTTLAAILAATHVGYKYAAATDFNWYRTSRGSAISTVDTGNAVAASTYIKLRVRRIDASTLGFTYNSTTEVQVTGTSVPGSILYTPVVWIRTTSNAHKSITVDYISMYSDGLSRF